MLMPRLSRTEVSPKLSAICGSAVTMTVLSNASMKNAQETMLAIAIAWRGGDALAGRAVMECWQAGRTTGAHISANSVPSQFFDHLCANGRQSLLSTGLRRRGS